VVAYFCKFPGETVIGKADEIKPSNPIIFFCAPSVALRTGSVVGY